MNPIAAVLSAAMLLRYGLKEENAAKRIEEAVSDVLDRGFRTRDIHTPGTVSLLFSWQKLHVVSSYMGKSNLILHE